jgi:release factor glutamine methyltransferase
MSARTRFGGLDIASDRRVLTPRTWTVVQSAWAAELAQRAQRPILELFAGVGHIGLAAARASGLALTQIDADPVACAFARRNAARAQLLDRVSIRCAELPGAVPDDERYGVIIVDPPYIPTDRVSDHLLDPPHTIDGGPDGLGPAAAVMGLLAERQPDTDVLLQLGGWDQADALADRLPADTRLMGVRAERDDRLILHLLTGAPPAPTRRVEARVGVER